MRVEADNGRSTTVGRMLVGSDQQLREEYRLRWFLNVAGPELISGVIAVLSLGALLFWISRPTERVFGWLALVGLFWCFWNLQYFADSVPFDDGVFWTLNADSMFAVFWAAFGFAATFLDVPHRRRIILASAAVCAGAIAIRHGLIATGNNPAPSYLIMWPLAFATLYLLGGAIRRSPSIENVAMFSAMTVSTAFGFPDLILLSTTWRGVTFQLQPYGGLLVFLAFGFAIGKRVLVALAAVEDVNETLELRVRDATEKLGQSEAARRRLEGGNAVDLERERMMREIHDGIGSSLITALAVAQRERQSPNTIATLQRSISDLRIGVDSLEPINGDVVMLLASLRHRMDRELGDAGLVFVWKTMLAPPLPWLDAVGALHILRILQEGIGNVLKHAGASKVEVDCVGAARNGVDGVLVTIADDGCGFDGSGRQGRGLANIAARAEALNANFSYESALGSGTKLLLWLPLVIGTVETA
ncbi:hypothetical protein KX816_09565 [Sphingosinicellaceae bacterium]|nr:hypothetical protein KX816_09565 [Sphingosinicellaceae bacterium]